MIPKSIIIGIVSILMAAAVASFRFPAQAVRLTTSALDLRTGELLYVEERTQNDVDGRPGVWNFAYKNPSGEVFVKRQVDFRSNPLRPDFRLTDLRNGYTEGAINLGGTIKVFTGGSPGDPYEEKILTVPEPAVVDAGFDYFVGQNWESLEAGKNVSFHFVAPSQLEYYSFRIRKDSDVLSNGRPASLVVLEIDNFFLRIFVKPIKVTYDKQTRTLVRYEGISNIYNDKGKSYHVTMDFKY